MSRPGDLCRSVPRPILSLWGPFDFREVVACAKMAALRLRGFLYFFKDRVCVSSDPLNTGRAWRGVQSVGAFLQSDVQITCIKKCKSLLDDEMRGIELALLQHGS